jgi:hypothetical protein
MSNKDGLIRDSDAPDNLELLLVVAVATILINRAFLSLTGYPRIAFGHFHIAHMLWGGLLMLVSLVMILHYWNPSVRRMAAFISGIGFGLFIDELGKFITKDNDYFFKPTIAIIYVIFVIIYLSFRRMRKAGPMAEKERELNRMLRSEMSDTQETESPWLRGYYSVRDAVSRTLERLLSAPRVIPTVMMVFVLKSAAQFGTILGIINPNWVPFENVTGLAVLGSLVSSIMVFTGLAVLGKNPLRGLHWLKRAILLNIFVTQVFLFYQSQLTAIWGLAADMIVYASIDFYLRRIALRKEI